jgi:predicted amidophosphoribosyltransferase
MLSTALDLLLPPSCVACQQPGRPLCRRCAAPLAGPAGRHAPDPCPAGLPPVWATASYGGSVRSALIGFKERNRRDLTGVLAGGLAVAVRAALAEPSSPGEPPESVLLVPVPSRRRSARRRGGDHVRRLAAAAAGRLDRPALVCPALHPAAGLVDAVGLSAADRRLSRVGAFALHGTYLEWLARWVTRGWPVVLVDDLVTTGATVAEAAAVLGRAGVTVTAAAVLAATERHNVTGIRGLC